MAIATGASCFSGTISAFAGNAFFTGACYSTQRLLEARMFSDRLSRIHFWGWQRG